MNGWLGKPFHEKEREPARGNPRDLEVVLSSKMVAILTGKTQVLVTLLVVRTTFSCGHGVLPKDVGVDGMGYDYHLFSVIYRGQ